MGMTMERMRAEEFGESMSKILDGPILLFSRVSLTKFSLESFYISCIKGYI